MAAALVAARYGPVGVTTTATLVDGFWILFCLRNLGVTSTSFTCENAQLLSIMLQPLHEMRMCE
jgi:hypothetical protein